MLAGETVWKQITFAPITTSKIKVLITGTSDGYSRLAEVEAWGVPAGSAADLRWLITDQLGSARMVLDHTGALANMTRHDYLPFGEEENNLASARSLYEQASRTRIGLEGSLLAFGAAMHTVMDNWSPAHRSFKLYDNSIYWEMAGYGNPWGALVMYGFDMLAHAEDEEREPTEDEMNHMIDEMRLRFYEVYGEDAYNRAICEREREKTAERLARMSFDQLLYCVGSEPRKLL